MPNFNPFSSDVEDTSFEQGLPVNQAVKNVAKTANDKADKAIEDANKAILDELYGPSTTPATGKHTDEAILDQLYGSGSPQDPGTDEANIQHTDASNAATRVASTHAGVSKTANVNPNQTPEEQAKMEKIRHELFGNYSAKFKSAPNGAQNSVTNLEQEMEKARKEREQKEMQRKRDEEEEEKRKKEEEEQQQQELVTPAGKKTGFQMGKKQQQPIALQMAKTKTEINRGSTG